MYGARGRIGLMLPYDNAVIEPEFARTLPHGVSAHVVRTTKTDRLELAEELGSLERQAGYRGGLALAARGRNDFDTAKHLLEEALALIAEQGYWHLRTRLQLWLAETRFDQAHYDEAEKILEEAIEIARSQQRTLLVEQGERLSTKLLALKEN